MREIVFDTETTGLDPYQDRIIELGGIELFKRFPTGRVFHHFINPQGREINADAQAVHGISAADLQASRPSMTSPRSSWPSSTAPGWSPTMPASTSASSMPSSRGSASRWSAPTASSTRWRSRARKHPMGPNSLDALCRRYGIDNSHRTKHGALLDSELLAEVYIELIGGKQAALVPGERRRSSGERRIESSIAIVVDRRASAAAAAAALGGRARRACRAGRRTRRSGDLETVRLRRQRRRAGRDQSHRRLR